MSRLQAGLKTGYFFVPAVFRPDYPSVCQDFYRGIYEARGLEPDQGDLFLVLGDRNLVWLIKHGKMRGLNLGRDIGMISYNENPLKEVIGEGGLAGIAELRLGEVEKYNIPDIFTAA